MDGSFGRLGIAAFAESQRCAKAGDDWAVGGFMRVLTPDLAETPRPRTEVERAAIIAMDVAMEGEARNGAVSKADRDSLSEVLYAAVRSVSSIPSPDGAESMTGLQMARTALVAMSSTMVARDQASGFEPEPLENGVLEAMRRHSGIEASLLDRADAHAVAMGNLDMLGSSGTEHMAAVLGRGRERSAHDWVEAELGTRDASWPRVEVAMEAPDRGSFRSRARGPVEAPMPASGRGVGID